MLALDEGDFTFGDSGNRTIQGKLRLRHIKTIKGGEVYKPWMRGTG